MNGIRGKRKSGCAQDVNPPTGIKEEENRYYVYVYLDPRKPGKYQYGRRKFTHEPIYVGKGCGQRYTDYKRNKSVFLMNKLKKISFTPICLKIKENLTESEAFVEEKKMIALIGRADIGTGPLTNLTKGGEGASVGSTSEDHKLKISQTEKEQFRNGRKQWNEGKTLSEEHIAKISAGNKGENNAFYGCTHTEEAKKIVSVKAKERYKTQGHPRQGAVLSEETKEKIRLAHIGLKHTPEAKMKMSIARKGKPQSPERILKQSIAITEWWRRRKENDK